MTRCSCGAAVVRPGVRSRLCGDLLEWCACAAGCGSTTTVLVEVCGHGRAYPREDGTWLCPDCGHTWAQHGEPHYYETDARRSARQAVVSGHWKGY